MKAFLIGLTFLLAASILGLISLWLLPFILALALFLRVVAFFILVVFFIWLLGKFIIFVWENSRGSSQSSP
ncbi:MAG: hypothetical protein GF375_03825 [Candidatus Omnitrophica bacterium]|nr:hypothetical protein [Candidatus Omnitrophota bacterium]MBD3269189.1 hypothetical protein [Candidatus Omnitrophota bacterium]